MSGKVSKIWQIATDGGRRSIQGDGAVFFGQAVVFSVSERGVVAQLGEHLPCTQGVRSSILLGSTKHILETRLIRLNCHRYESIDGNLVWYIRKFIKNLVEIEFKQAKKYLLVCHTYVVSECEIHIILS